MCCEMLAMDIQTCIHTAADIIRSRITVRPVVGLVLGSGLGDFCDQMQNAVKISFSELPDFPQATVEGHCGEFWIGTYHDVPIVALRGRLHYYEGYRQSELTMPIRVMALLGVQTLLLTNAAGGINTAFHPGVLMLLEDHINDSGSNPLIGANLSEFGPRFADMSEVYDSALRNAVFDSAKNEGIDIVRGTYLMYSGPSYETPAEIRFFRSIGADAVGMSTVPEAIVARHCGLRVLGVSCITNMAAGVLKKKLSHAEVLEVAEAARAQFLRLLDIAIACATKDTAFA